MMDRRDTLGPVFVVAPLASLAVGLWAGRTFGWAAVAVTGAVLVVFLLMVAATRR
jgi:hypothetical protein